MRSNCGRWYLAVIDDFSIYHIFNILKYNLLLLKSGRWEIKSSFLWRCAKKETLTINLFILICCYIKKCYL